jgi:hypothetical protein
MQKDSIADSHPDCQVASSLDKPGCAWAHRKHKLLEEIRSLKVHIAELETELDNYVEPNHAPQDQAQDGDRAGGCTTPFVRFLCTAQGIIVPSPDTEWLKLRNLTGPDYSTAAAKKEAAAAWAWARVNASAGSDGAVSADWSSLPAADASFVSTRRTWLAPSW